MVEGQSRFRFSDSYVMLCLHLYIFVFSLSDNNSTYYSWMYWTDSGRDRIEKASLDGSFRTTLHSTGLSNSIGLTLDYQNQTLYWVEHTYYGRIERSSVNGSNRETILSSGLYYPWAIAYFDGTLYLTEIYNRRIISVSVIQPITSIVSSVGRYPYDIKVIAEDQQRIGCLTQWHGFMCSVHRIFICMQLTTRVMRKTVLSSV